MAGTHSLARGGGPGAKSGGRSDARPLRTAITPRLRTPGRARSTRLTLTRVVETLATLGKARLPQQLARWLDALDETGRWALIKLVTGGLRIGVSARLAKTAVAALGRQGRRTTSKLIWPGLAPPYATCSPGSRAAPSGPPAATRHRSGRRCWRMRSMTADLAALEPADFMAEWKWDGIRVQAAAGRRTEPEDGKLVARLYSRTGEEISRSFPDLLDALRLPGAIDGELLIMRDGRVQSFNVLQQRLNRKTVTREAHGGISRASARL